MSTLKRLLTIGINVCKKLKLKCYKKMLKITKFRKKRYSVISKTNLMIVRILAWTGWLEEIALIELISLLKDLKHMRTNSLVKQQMHLV